MEKPAELNDPWLGIAAAIPLSVKASASILVVWIRGTRGRRMRSILAALGLLIVAATPQPASAWGDDGHKVVALIAEHYLTPEPRNTVNALLAQDTDPLSAHDIASEATWADKYRNQHRETANWHFVDIEIDHPDISSACAGRPPLPPNTLASNGPPACILDKVQQFNHPCDKAEGDARSEQQLHGRHATRSDGARRYALGGSKNLRCAWTNARWTETRPLRVRPIKR
jgi:hypothetical protein